MSERLVGRRVPRIEDDDLLRGRARFIDDIDLPGMLHAAFVRSPYGHAGVDGVDKRAALALPGVHAVLTAADLAAVLRTDRLVTALPSPSIRQQLDRPVLAGDEVVHVGEPIAMVLADDRYVAEDAAALIDVDFDPLPVAADCLAALSSGAPPAHRAAPDNLVAAFEMAYGDADAAFRSAPHVLTERLWQHRGGSHSIECRGNVAYCDPVEDRLTLWTSSQAPHAAKRLLGEILGLSEAQVRVAVPDLGGGFGPKLIFYPEDAAVAAAAVLLRRPVKWIEDRYEHFVATTQERDQHWNVAIAVDGDGRILGIRGAMVHDHGAYTARGLNVPYGAAQAMTLAYHVPAFQLDVKLAATNKPPVTPVRGAGQPQGAFAMERLMDRVARELRLDRAEVRRRNLVTAEQMPCTKPLVTRGGVGVVLDSGDFPAVQESALERAGWHTFAARKQAAAAKGRYLGIGLANFVEATGRGPFESVSVRIGPSGIIQVASGATAMGQGIRTMLAQVVAEQLGGDVNLVRVTTGDTDAIARGIGGFNSRQAVMAGTSAHVAACKVREQVLRVVAHRLEVAEDDLVFEGGAISVAGAPQLRVTLGEVALAVDGLPGYVLPPGVTPGLEATEQVLRDEMAYANGTAVAEVEVDVETGAVTINRLVFAHDCGRAVNPMIVEGQVLGGIAHGIGNALFERMLYDDEGQPLTAHLGDYLMVTATEMPEVEQLHHESPSPLNPLGIKGVGEAGVIPVPAAIVSAIEDALSPFGVRIGQAPISPQEIVALIAARR